MKYRRKAETIEAWLVTRDGHPSWLSEALNGGVAWYQGGEVPFYTIATEDGARRACVGDYICRSSDGSIYPIKADVFEKMYEAVE